jgi:hypothetical protein
MSFIAINQANFPMVALVHEIDDSGDFVKAQIGAAWTDSEHYAGNQEIREYAILVDPDGNPYFNDEDCFFYLSDTLRTN